MADTFTQSDSLEVIIIYLPHALAQLKNFLKYMKLLPEFSDGNMWMAHNCRWIILYIARIQKVIRETFLFQAVPPLNITYREMAKVWDPRRLMSRNSSWLQRVSAIDQHKVMTCTWLLPQILADADVDDGDKILSLEYLETEVSSGMRKDSPPVAEEEIPKRLQSTSAQWITVLTETISPQQKGQNASDNLSFFPCESALSIAQKLNTRLRNSILDSKSEGSLRLLRNCSLLPTAMKKLSELYGGGMHGSIILYLLMDLCDQKATIPPCVEKYSFLHCSDANQGRNKDTLLSDYKDSSLFFSLIHMLVFGIIVGSYRYSGDIVEKNAAMSIDSFLCRCVNNNDIDIHTKDEDVVLPPLISVVYISSCVAAASSIGALDISFQRYLSIDEILIKVYRKSVSILKNISYIEPLPCVVSDNSFKRVDYGSVDSVVEILSTVIEVGINIISDASKILSHGYSIWDDISLSRYTENFDLDTAHNDPSLHINGLRNFCVLLSTSFSMCESQDYLAWATITKEADALSQALMVWTLNNLQETPGIFCYFVSAVQAAVCSTHSSVPLATYPELPGLKSLKSPLLTKLLTSRQAIKRLGRSKDDCLKILRESAQLDSEFCSFISNVGKQFRKACCRITELDANFINFGRHFNTCINRISGCCIFFAQYSAYLMLPDNDNTDFGVKER